MLVKAQVVACYMIQLTEMDFQLPLHNLPAEVYTVDYQWTMYQLVGPSLQTSGDYYRQRMIHVERWIAKDHDDSQWPVLDVSKDDLVNLFHLASAHASMKNLRDRN